MNIKDIQEGQERIFEGKRACHQAYPMTALPKGKEVGGSHENFFYIGLFKQALMLRQTPNIEHAGIFLPVCHPVSLWYHDPERRLANILRLEDTESYIHPFLPRHRVPVQKKKEQTRPQERRLLNWFLF